MGYQYPGCFVPLETVLNGQCSPLVSERPSFVITSSSEVKHEETSQETTGSHLRRSGSQIPKNTSTGRNISEAKIEENLKEYKQETPIKVESPHQSTPSSNVGGEEGTR